MRLRLPDQAALTEGICEELHWKALEILKAKGIRVHSPDVRRILRKAGASVDVGLDIVTFPPDLIDEALSSCPHGFNLYDLDGNALPQSQGTILDSVGTYIEALSWLDCGSDRLRPSTLADLETGLQISDALDLVRWTGIIVWPTDLPAEKHIPVATLAILSRTRKPLIVGFHNERHVRVTLKALQTAAPELDLGRQPTCVCLSSPTSPLVYDRDSGEALLCALENGMAVLSGPSSIGGATSPFSLIGTVLQQVAENLFILALRHAVNPDSPALWGGAGAPMDMNTGDVSYGAPERSLMQLANVDMACYYGIPCHSPSASVDSCLIDCQMGVEKGWTFFTRAFSRAATGMAVGCITNGKGVSAEAMVIDADIIGCLRRLKAGIETV